jgi:F0F1-type ATP synthase assembly protein I
MSLTGMGFELLAAVAGFTFLGYWIDRHYETSPWGLVICALLGIIGGLYNFIRTATRAAGTEASGEGNSKE